MGYACGDLWRCCRFLSAVGRSDPASKTFMEAGDPEREPEAAICA